MASSSADTAERINFLRRIWWGTVRVHPEYRRAVADFLRRLRGAARLHRTRLRMPAGRSTGKRRRIAYEIPILPPAEHSEEERAWETAREALAAYRQLLSGASSPW